MSEVWQTALGILLAEGLVLLACAAGTMLFFGVLWIFKRLMKAGERMVRHRDEERRA
jgi:hypothetical protein